jgi:hypothetical protein
VGAEGFGEVLAAPEQLSGGVQGLRMGRRVHRNRARLAQGKNRSGLNWFLLSLLRGPIATFLIVVWAPLPDR